MKNVPYATILEFKNEYVRDSLCLHTCRQVLKPLYKLEQDRQRFLLLLKEFLRDSQYDENMEMTEALRYIYTRYFLLLERQKTILFTEKGELLMQYLPDKYMYPAAVRWMQKKIHGGRISTMREACQLYDKNVFVRLGICLQDVRNYRLRKSVLDIVRTCRELPDWRKEKYRTTARETIPKAVRDHLHR